METTIFFYDFDKRVDAELFLNIVRKVKSTGFRVRTFVSYMGLKNQKLLADLEIKTGNTFLKNPCCEERHIWAFCDVPHLLKLMRNYLIDKVYQLPDGKKLKES